MRSRARIFVAVAASALVLAAAASASFSAGTFQGTTAQKFALTVKASQTKLTTFTTKVNLKCTDGSKIDRMRFFLNSGVFIRISSTGEFARTFNARFKTPNGKYNVRDHVVISGTFVGRSAHGKVQRSRRYYLTSNGKYAGTCDTGSVSWSVRHV